MRRALFVLPLIVLLLALPALAQQNRIAATIPFDFVVRGVTLPAGDYDTQPMHAASVWRIANQESNHTVAFSAALQSYRNAEPRMLFHRYGKTYFLHQIWTNAMGVTLPESRMELQLRARVGAPVVVAVLVRR